MPDNSGGTPTSRPSAIMGNPVAPTVTGKIILNIHRGEQLASIASREGEIKERKKNTWK